MIYPERIASNVSEKLQHGYHYDNGHPCKRFKTRTGSSNDCYAIGIGQVSLPILGNRREKAWKVEIELEKNTQGSSRRQREPFA